MKTSEWFEVEDDVSFLEIGFTFTFRWCLVANHFKEVLTCFETGILGVSLYF